MKSLILAGMFSGLATAALLAGNGQPFTLAPSAADTAPLAPDLPATQFATPTPVPIPGLPEDTSGIPPITLEERNRQMAAMADFPIPEPVRTPYDDDPPARQAYLEQYRRAYRAGVVGFYAPCEPARDTPHRDAISDGDSAGSLAGFDRPPTPVWGSVAADPAAERVSYPPLGNWRRVLDAQVEALAHPEPDDFGLPAPVRVKDGWAEYLLPVPVGQAMLTAPTQELTAYLRQLLAGQSRDARAWDELSAWLTVAEHLDEATYQGTLLGCQRVLLGRGGYDGPVHWRAAYRFAIRQPGK